MTYQEELARLEKALKAWQCAVKFHDRSAVVENIKLAKAGLDRVQVAIDELKRSRHDEAAHEELMYIPLFSQE